MNTPRIMWMFHLYVGEHPRPFDINHYYAVASQIIVNNVQVKLITNDMVSLMSSPYIDLLEKNFPNDVEIKEMTADDRCQIETLGIIYPAHMADFLRLKYLHLHGGLYADTDCIAVRPYPKSWFTSGKMYWGYEDWSHVAICNNVLISPIDNAFLSRIYKEFITRFDPRKAVPGNNWAYYGVTMPLEVYRSKNARELRKYIQLCDHISFNYYWMKYEEIEKIFFLDDSEKYLNLKNNYTLHLWENRTRDLIKNFSTKYFKDNHSTYAKVINYLALKYNKGKELLLV